MIATTESDDLLDSIIPSIDTKMIKSGIMNTKNERKFITWIDVHAKDEYKEKIKSLLSNQSKYAE